MAKANTVVEKNQTIMLGFPKMLEKYVQILRILNFSPDLADVIKSGIIGAQSPITGDVLTFTNAKWSDFVRLETQAREEAGGKPPKRFNRPSGGAEVQARLGPGSSWWIGEERDGKVEGGEDDDDHYSDVDSDDPPTMIEDDIAPKLLEAFSPLNENNLPELGAVYSTMVTAVNLGVGLPTQRGIQLLSWAAHQFMANAQNGNSEEHEANRLNSILDSDVMRSVLMGRSATTTSAGGTPAVQH